MRLVWLLILVINQAIAGEFDVFGYYSQSVVKSNGINLGGSFNNKASFDKRDLTIFGDLKSDVVNARFAIGTQDEPSMRDQKIFVKYALLDKQLRFDDNIVGLRLGKVPHMFGFYNTTRNAPTTGQFIYLPEGLPGYHENFKYIAMSGYGLQGYWYTNLGDHTTLEVTGTYTKAEMTSNREVVGTHINDGRLGTFDEDKSYVKGFIVEARHKNTSFYYNLNNLYFWFVPEAKYQKVLPTGRTETHVHVVGVKQFVGDFEVGAEVLTVRMYGDAWKELRNTDSGNPLGYVLTGTWHATDNLDLSFYHTEYYMQDGDSNGTKQSAAAKKEGTWRPAHWYYTKANSLAFKYTIDDNWTVRAQYTKGSGIAAFTKTDNWNAGKDWEYGAIQIIYSF